MADSKISSESSKPANGKADAAGDVLKASPVMMAIAKRLRAAKKKLGRIEEIEVKKAAGKEINADQVEALKAKAGVLAVIDELEKLSSLIKEALDEELSKASEKAVAEALEAAKPEEEEVAPDAQHTLTVDLEVVEKLVQLLYLSQVFSAPDGDERTICLQEEYTNETEGVPLTPADLDLIHMFGKLLISRADGQLLCHKDAMESCKELVLKVLKDEDEGVPELNVTVRDVLSKLERIVGSSFMTIVPAPTPEKTVSSPVAEEPISMQQPHLQQVLPQEAYPQIPTMPVQATVPSQMMHSMPTAPQPSAPPLPMNSVNANDSTSPLPDDQDTLLTSPNPEVLPEVRMLLAANDLNPEGMSQAPPQPQPPRYYPTFHHHHQAAYLPTVPPPTANNAASMPAHAANGPYGMLPESVPGYGFFPEPQAPVDGALEVGLTAPPAAESAAAHGQMPQMPAQGRGSGEYNGRRGPGGDRGRGGRSRRGDGNYVARGEGGYGRGTGRGYYGRGGRGGGRGGRGRAYQPTQVTVV